jgi:5,10-methylene-tetrahydrofolate dehydrogenase/methenyl tetrahydrofolate cyclohydrolase
MYRTHHVRITNNSTKNCHRLRRTEDKGNAFVCTVGKENTLPATAIRKKTTIVSLGEETTQEQNTLNEELQGEHSELSRSWTTLSLVSPPIKSHPKVQKK